MVDGDVRHGSAPRSAGEDLEWWAQLFAGGLSMAVDAAARVSEGAGRRPVAGRVVVIDDRQRTSLVLDATLDVTLRSIDLGLRTARLVARSLRPLASPLLRPPLLNPRHWPETRLRKIAERGRRERSSGQQQTGQLLAAIVPAIVDAVLDRIDLTRIVLERVRLGSILSAVDTADIDEIASRIDLDAIIDRVPLERVLDQLDVDAIAARIDLDAAVSRVDMDAIAARIDLDAAVSRVDVDAIAARIDLVALARYVIDEIDLPEIIRESTGSMASETVLGVRMQSMYADERVNRVIDRMLLRRHARDTAGRSEGAGEGAGD
jgi:hypothetical protein